MSDDRESTEPVVKPPKPYQFTVRTFFAAAVWLGLLLAAVTAIEEEGLRWSVVLGLAWIGVAELYRRFRATRALVALWSGPMVLLALWGVFLATMAHQDGHLPPGSWRLMFASGWGIVLSVVVIIERAVERWVIGPVYRRRRACASELRGGPLPGPSSGRLRSAAVLFAIHSALALVAIVISLGRTEVGTCIGLVLVLVTDFPLMPLYGLIPGHDPPEVMPEVALASLVLGGALYAAMGWLVADVAARFERRARPAGPPEGASGDVRPNRDGGHA